MFAKDCFGKRLKYKKNILNFEPENWIGDKFTIPGIITYNDVVMIKKKVDMNDWLQFFGIWIAEGWTCDNTVYIAANKLRVQKVLRKIIPSMGFHLIETDGGEVVNNVEIGSESTWRISNVQLAGYMKQFSIGSINKFLPEWVWSLNKEQCRLLLTSLELGDGHTTKSNSRNYYTSSKRLCEDITRLALHAGYSTNCRVPEGRKAGSTSIMKDGRKITSTEDNWLITVIQTKNEPEMNHGHTRTQDGQSENWVDFDGKVYCLTVRTGVFLVRENGKPVWTGNSRAA
jgi:hypothetical protein